MSRRRLAVAGLIALITVLAAGAGVGGFVITAAVRGEPAVTVPATTPSAVTAAGSTPRAPRPSAAAPRPAPAAVARALVPLLSARGLGPQVRAEVLDVQDGTVLFSREPAAPTAPASTAKLLTAAAVLAVRPSG